MPQETLFSIDDLVPSDIQRDLIIREPSARSWLSQLPLNVARMCKEWELTPLEALHGGRAGAVVKVLSQRVYGPPEPHVLKFALTSTRASQEAAALEYFSPTGACVQLERHNEETGALLLQWLPLAPLAMTSNLPGLPSFSEFESMAELLKKLREVPLLPPAHDLNKVATLEQFHSARLASGAFREVAPGTRPPTPANLARANSTLEFLVSSAPSSSKRQLLHGDLNSGNVLGLDSLKAIDPRPLLGEPSYDTAVMALKHCPSNPEKAAAFLAGLTGDDRERTLCWLFVAQASRV